MKKSNKDDMLVAIKTIEYRNATRCDKVGMMNRSEGTFVIDSTSHIHQQDVLKAKNLRRLPLYQSHRGP